MRILSCNARIARFLQIAEEDLSEVRKNCLIPFGRVVRAHGVVGEVKLDLCRFIQHEDMSDKTCFCNSRGERYNNLKYIKCNELRAIAKFDGCSDRTTSQKFIRSVLFVAASNIKERERCLSYYSLLDTEVIRENGEKYGTIVGYFNFGAGPIIEVFKDDMSDTVFIPYHALHDFDPQSSSIRLTELETV